MPSDAAGTSFDLARLRDGLKPFRLHWFPRLGSTNTHAAVLRDRGTLFAPAVVLTGHQLAGRGRGAHRWWSPAGCLTVTFVLPTDAAVEAHQVPLLAGLAVRRAVAALLTDGDLRSRDRKGAEASNGPVLANDALGEKSALPTPESTSSTRLPPRRSRAPTLLTPPLPRGRGSLNASSAPSYAATPHSAGVRLKWPNDVQHDGRKVAGLLCERVMKADLIGVGLNVNVDPAAAPADIRPTLTSLAAIAGRPFDMTGVLVAVAAALRQVMRERSQHPFGVLLKEYDEHHALIGRRVSVLDAGDGQAVDGRCEGLDEMGRLLVRDRTRVHRVIAGQVVAR
jgi:biotin-(acetyl-CoA carboxylase) ligase